MINQSINQSSNNDKRALHTAAQDGDEAIVPQQVEHNADINEQY